MFPYGSDVAQRVGRGIALLFHDRGTRRGWVISSTPQSHFTLRKDPVPILQDAGWAPGPVWTGGKSRLHRDAIPDRPDRSQSLYWLNYPAHSVNNVVWVIYEWACRFLPDIRIANKLSISVTFEVTYKMNSTIFIRMEVPRKTGATDLSC